MAAPHPEDRAAGIRGLILGAVALFIVLFTIVHFTNRHYAAREAPAAAAETK